MDKSDYSYNEFFQEYDDLEEHEEVHKKNNHTLPSNLNLHSTVGTYL